MLETLSNVRKKLKLVFNDNNYMPSKKKKKKKTNYKPYFPTNLIYYPHHHYLHQRHTRIFIAINLITSTAFMCAFLNLLFSNSPEHSLQMFKKRHEYFRSYNHLKYIYALKLFIYEKSGFNDRNNSHLIFHI